MVQPTIKHKTMNTVERLLQPRENNFKVNKKYKIYTLSDPITNEIKWVGMTRNFLSKRLSLHCNSAYINKQRNPEKYEWIMYLRKLGLRPIIEIIEDEINNERDAIEIETFWTYQFKSWGFLLYNKFYGKDIPLEVKENMSKISKRRGMSISVTIAASEKRKIKVVQLTKQGDYIETYNFIKEAADKIKCDRGDITKCCKGKIKTAGGYKWVYLSEYLAYQPTTII